MKFTCQTELMKKALRLLKPQYHPDKPTSIHALKSKLKLNFCESYYAGGNALSIEYTFPAEVHEGGVVTIHSERLEQICEYTPDEMLHFSLHEWHARLDIDGKKHRHSLNCHHDERVFPHSDLLAESNAPWYHFDAPHFCQGLKRVLFATPKDPEERPFMSGVLCHRHAGRDRMVATDGKRMAIFNLESQGQPSGAEGDFPMRAMPYPACVKFVDVIEFLGAQTCRLRFGEKHLSFECEDVSVRGLFEGDYPGYLNILPDPKPPLRVQVNRETLMWALELAPASQQKTVHRTEFRVESGRMTLEHNRPEVGRSRVQIPVQYDGPATSAVFDAQFIKEALPQTDATDVTFCFRPQEERLQSMVIELGEGFDYLVMPMR